MEVPLESKNDDKNIQKESSIEKNNIYNLEEFLDEEEEPLNPGGQETLLDKCNLENICFAPGEGKTPIHLMLDQFSDELSFPTLFCGHAKQFLTKFSYSDQTKIQLQHKDRRFARTDYLLYTFKKRQLIQLSSAIATCLRKKRNEDGKYTAGQVRQANFLDQLIRSDMGFHFLSRIAGSPAYWKHEKTKLLCMIRQFGIPTLFFTVSAAETAWPELIKVLAQVVDQKDVTLEEAASMPYLEKTRLIRTDPITCARYFDYRFKLLFKHMKSQNGPFKQNPIEHHYYRIEFQHRGSPHVHGLLWLSNAPKFQETPESFKECAEFANRYITCNSDLESVRDIIQFNTHHHSKSCQKEVRGHKVCRYGIPYLPMDKSVILTPIKIDKTKEADLRKAMSEKFLMIMRRLKDKPDLSFENFLADLGMSKDEYLNVIQHNIFKTTLFLERLPKDGFINNFNAEMFSMMKSNMDIQLVFEPYGCCTYIVNYINKSQRGVSDILMKTMEEIKKEIMRQSEDKSFAVALNNMAFGKMTDEDVQLIKSREVDSIDQIPEDTMHLFCTNAEVDAFNEMKLSTFKTERAVSQARDVIKGSCSERLKNLFLEHAKSLKKGESFGLMLNLILQVDAKYMISMNVDTSDGIVNGATGILRQIDYDRNKIPFRVWMEFFDSKSGQECRKRNESLKKSMGVLYTWTPIEKAARAIKVQKGSNVHVERLQFPLVISEGITIHKSQGATYKQVAVHVGNRMTRTSTYVACSRATKLSGLYIIGNFKAPKPVTEKDAAYKELVNMQENKLITSRNGLPICGEYRKNNLTTKVYALCPPPQPNPTQPNPTCGEYRKKNLTRKVYALCPPPRHPAWESRRTY
ncbi:uncharacterized protein LOC126748056 isoform X16 [Anthonomus grandis grandis]|uniref:uncharacterized protein LOC126748056 isoform X16 n=1 Tax=Anthonomus grandis grandis TaxID=2921223 RepID=UPI002165C727|nr:uncharacterized protein LOC126748056 isoform X16 [Anthonomus grandis grandis]